MAETLLKCPFCGKRPFLRKGMRYKKDGWYEWQNIKAGNWCWRPAVGCRPCKIEREFDSVEEAVEWWNKRK